MNTKLMLVLSTALFAVGIGASRPSYAVDQACVDACSEECNDCISEGFHPQGCIRVLRHCIALC